MMMMSMQTPNTTRTKTNSPNPITDMSQRRHDPALMELSYPLWVVPDELEDAVDGWEANFDFCIGHADAEGVEE